LSRIEVRRRPECEQADGHAILAAERSLLVSLGICQHDDPCLEDITGSVHATKTYAVRMASHNVGRSR
jgi:hypothetical protein